MRSPRNSPKLHIKELEVPVLLGRLKKESNYLLATSEKLASKVEMYVLRTWEKFNLVTK